MPDKLERFSPVVEAIRVGADTSKRLLLHGFDTCTHCPFCDLKQEMPTGEIAPNLHHVAQHYDDLPDVVLVLVRSCQIFVSIQVCFDGRYVTRPRLRGFHDVHPR